MAALTGDPYNVKIVKSNIQQTGHDVIVIDLLFKLKNENNWKDVSAYLIKRVMEKTMVGFMVRFKVRDVVRYVKNGPYTFNFNSFVEESLENVGKQRMGMGRCFDLCDPILITLIGCKQ